MAGVAVAVLPQLVNLQRLAVLAVMVVLELLLLFLGHLQLTLEAGAVDQGLLLALVDQEVVAMEGFNQMADLLAQLILVAAAVALVMI